MNELKPCVAMRENQRLLTLAVTTAATAQPVIIRSRDGTKHKVKPDHTYLSSKTSLPKFQQIFHIKVGDQSEFLEALLVKTLSNPKTSKLIPFTTYIMSL